MAVTRATRRGASSAERGVTSSEDEERDVRSAPAGVNMDGDRWNLALLLLLYTLQGVPMGLASSVTFLLQEKGASYAAQGASGRAWQSREQRALSS
jgi:PAT family acetyl-CoA transporter-like MFS transporter 1